MKRNKFASLILTLSLSLFLAACGGTPPASGASQNASSASSAQTEASQTSSSVQSSSEESSSATAPETVTITALNGAKEAVELEIPYNPQRIAVMDLAALDILDTFNLGDRITGVSKGSSIDYLQTYMDDETILNLGTIKEADLEAVMECEPDLIFIGGRLSKQYDALNEIAPVVFLSTDANIGLVESVRNNVMTIASLFGMENQAEEKIAGFDARIHTLANTASDKTAVIGMCTSGSFNTLGNDGRCSIIGREIGFKNLADGDVTSTHGNESSFELLVKLNPDYIFVMDRDSAIGTDGAQLAQEIMENELVMKTAAHQNGNVVYLEHSAVWYTAEGGITALDYMLADLESVLIK